MAVQRVLFDLSIEKNYSAKLCVFSLALYRDLERLLIATSRDRWVPRM